YCRLTRPGRVSHGRTRAERHPDPRPHPVRSRHDLHPVPRVARSRRHQDRAAGRRAVAAQPAGGAGPRRDVLPRLQCQQAQRDDRSEESRRPRVVPPDGRASGRRRGEFRARPDGKAGPRLRAAPRDESAPHRRPHQGLRALRPVPRVQELRHDRSGDGWRDERNRLRRPRARPLRRGHRDTGTGVHTAAAILAAYIQRQRTGQGQLVEVAMQEVVANFLRGRYADHYRDGKPSGRRGNELVGGVPGGAYPCAPGGPNDYAYIYVQPMSEEMWREFATAIGRGDLLADARCKDAKARWEHRDALNELIRAWTRVRTKHEVMAVLG